MARIRSLQKLESLAQDLIEGSIGRLLGYSTFHRELALRLTRYMAASEHHGVVGDMFTVYLAPDNYAALRSEDSYFDQELSRFLSTYADQVGYSVNQPISVELFSADGVALDRPVIVPSCTVISSERTKEMPALGNSQRLEELRSADAFLIEGKRHISLDRPTITIGRHLDNDLIVDSRDVSRHHAQIRWRRGRFVIHDLGSKGGTMVNKQPISEKVLRPGDVITFGSTSYIFGEGLTPLDRADVNQSRDGHTLSLSDRS